MAINENSLRPNMLLQLSSSLWLSGDLRRYRQKLAAELRRQLHAVQEISDRYPALDPRRAVLLSGTERHSIARLISQMPRLIVAGETGSGKSTFLRQACLIFAENLTGPMPILANLSTGYNDNPLGFLQEKVLAHGTRRLATTLSHLLRGGQVILFLDDLDERLQSAGKRAADQWISFLQSYPQVRCVLSCRPESAASLAGFELARILPLSEEAVEQTLEAFRAEQDHISGTALINDSAKALARVRLALAMMAHLGQPVANWPRLIGRYLESKRLPAELEHKLCILALEAMPKRAFEMTKAVEYLGSEGVFKANEAGLLNPTDTSPRWLGFSSPWFQDYFAACALKGRWESLDDSRWWEYISQPVWWRTVAFLASLLDERACLRLIQRILATGQGDKAILLAIACASFSGFGEQEVQERLLQRLDEKGFGTHWEAASFSADIAGIQAVDFLLRIQQQASGVHKAQLYALIGEIGGYYAAEQLAAHGLEETGELTTITVSRALQQLGALAALALVNRLNDPQEQIRAKASEILVQIGAPAVSALTDKLYSAEEEGARLLAATILGRIGAFAVPSLLAAIRHPDDRISEAGVKGLQLLTDPSASPFLLPGLRDRSSRVRREVVLALARIAGQEATAHLVGMLKDVEKEVRLAALKALGEITAFGAIPAIVRLLRDPDGDVRRLATDILLQFGPRIVQPLVLEFQDSNWDLSGVHISLIERLGAAAITPLASLLLDRRWRVRRASAQALRWTFSPDAVPVLATALRDRDARVREAAASALGKLALRDAVPILLGALMERNRGVKLAVLRALGEIGDRRAIPSLIDVLSDRNKEVRDEAIRSLASIGRLAVNPLLEVLRRKQNWRIRQAAIEALKLIGDQAAVPPLTESLQDPDWRVRQAAAEALGEIKDSRAIASLVAALADRRDSPRWAAIDALAKIGGPSLPALIEALQSSNWHVRWAAVAALGRIGEPALPALVAALGHQEQNVRWAAEAALAQIGDRAIPALSSALHSPQAIVRQAAVEALSQIGTPAAREVLDRFWMGSWPAER